MTNLAQLPWLPANAAGRAAGYVEGCHYVSHDGRRSLDAVVLATGPVCIVGICSCLTKIGAELFMRRHLANPGRMELDRTIDFDELFGP